MEKEDVKVAATKTAETEAVNTKKPYEKERFEFALSIITEGKESLICRRSFSIDGFINHSMRTSEFEECVGEIVELIQNDLARKSRIYLWYHTPVIGVTGHYAVEGVDEDNNKTTHYVSGNVVGGFLERDAETGKMRNVIGYFPEWEPEVTSCELPIENQVMLKFTIYDYGHEIISRGWDATVYPSYVRKNIDLTNRLVRLNKDKISYTYDKEEFFAKNEGAYGDLLMLKEMIMNREDLIPQILSLIRKSCSANSGYYDNINDYHTMDRYENSNGKEGRKYNFNINAENRKYYNAWGEALQKKTAAYAEQHYYMPLTSRGNKQNKNVAKK